ncbi:MAG: hypothetical protein RBR15_10650 [Sphaerochaeta sp.]|nr:hypothetical protein [Sphaerochaeta sp.]
MEVSCPVCGSKKTHQIQMERVLSEGFNVTKSVTLSGYACDNCDFSGDFLHENKELLKQTKEELQSRVMIESLEYFSEQDIRFAGIERALGLPQRTLTKWKNKKTKPSASAIALFTYLRTFPWLLKVADTGFDLEAAQKIHQENAAREMIACLPKEKLEER